MTVGIVQSVPYMYDCERQRTVRYTIVIVKSPMSTIIKNQSTPGLPSKPNPFSVTDILIL